MSHESPRLAPYRAALQRLSQRTGASVPQLALSFMLLHELTAIVPFGAAFYASSAAGLGERAVDALVADDMQPAWVRDTARRWVDEGGAMAARVGRRYGVFGYEKRAPGEDKAADAGLATRAADVAAGERIAGDVANAIVAYAVVKALLPLRIGASLYLSPSFSRWVLEPARVRVMRVFRPRRTP